MIQYIFKRSLRNGDKSRTWYGRYKHEWMPKQVEVNLDVTDKQVAEKKLRLISEEAQKENAGLLSSGSCRLASRKPIAVHLESYLNDMRTTRHSSRYVKHLRRYVTRICRACKWVYLQDINSARFTDWRSSESFSGSTANHYHTGINAFLNWLVARECLSVNPLQKVKKIDVRRNQGNKRKALTSEQFFHLLEILPDMKLKAAHLLAVYTGMRRGEIEKLEWTDLDLNDDNPLVKLRASITKNSQPKNIVLRPEVVKVLRQLPRLSDKVIPRLPRFSRMRKYWIKAGIPVGLNSGYDFHSLRVTLCTWFQQAGVAPRVVQDFMRHSDPRLTASVYTDTELFDMRGAVNRLPSLSAPEPVSQIVSQTIVKNRQNLSLSVFCGDVANNLQVVGSSAICHVLSTLVKGGEMVGVAELESATSTMST